MQAEKKRVFVGNLPPDTTQTDITKWFSKFGSVLSVEIKQHPNSSVFAFLDLETDEDKLKSCKICCCFFQVCEAFPC
jgi:RNA recognition motif-containing protein